MPIDRTRPFAVLGDLRANATALDAVLAELARLGIDQGLVIGDLLGYGPDPEVVAERMRARSDRFVVLSGWPGRMISDASDPGALNPVALRAISWARARVRGRLADWLRTLPTRWTDGGICAVCATPTSPDAAFLPWNDAAALQLEMDAAAMPTFVGTIGIAGAASRRDGWRSAAQLPAGIATTDASIFCPGSVGQPRDGDPRAAVAIVEDTVVTWRRVAYDIEETAARIQAHGLYVRTADRLRVGR